MQVHITALYAGVLSLIVVFLALRVVVLRRSQRIGIGDGDSKELGKAIRVHGNAAENLPFTLLLMLILEVNGGSVILLHIAGAGTVLARLLHALGLSKTIGSSFGRVAGASTTWLIIMGLAITNFYYVLKAGS